MSFPCYQSYKGSGVEWSSEIPETWTPTRLRFLLLDGYDGLKIGPFGSQLTSDMLEDEGAYKVYGQENIIANDFVRGNRYIGGEKFRELSVYEINPGDLLITMMGTSGRCDVAPSDIAHGIMDSHLLRMRVTTAALADFVRLLIDEAAYVGMQIQLAGKGSIMHGLNSSIVKNLLLFVPPIEEQAQILAFIGRETAKIDALVAEQRRLMELLKEKRQAVISHAVTKGLNPNAPMKPSGIKWLGDVPEHWEVKRLKHNLGLLTEKTDRRDHPVALENIEGWTGRFIPTETEFQGEGIAFEAGDILFGKLRPYLAKVYRAKFSGEAVGDFHVMRPVTGIDSRYAQYQILNREFIAIVDGSTFGSKMPRASWEFVGGMKVTTPPLSEQIQIAAFLDSELAKFDTLTTEAQYAIDLLQERRTALISAAVTGQIDVRQLAEKEAA